jgi:hypothetical protein
MNKKTALKIILKDLEKQFQEAEEVENAGDFYMAISQLKTIYKNL